MFTSLQLIAPCTSSESAGIKNRPYISVLRAQWAFAFDWPIFLNLKPMTAFSRESSLVSALRWLDYTF